MHAARLGFQGVELLTTGKLNLPIEGEPAEWLRAVRRGEVDFDDWWDRCQELDATLEALQYDESLPAEADRRRVTDWSSQTHLELWTST
jgi:hypothetical protein